ncbi:MAG: hypothetical protein LUH07_03360 [Lachnospiraceae bacterium]|nr:hypothetical protein [Lachnospiraceae bacterium]
MRKTEGKTEKSIKESDVRKIEQLCCITALLTIVLSFLFMSGILQNIWVLNFILIIGVIMNLTAAITALIKKQTLVWSLCLLLAIAQALTMIYFMI